MVYPFSKDAVKTADLALIPDVLAGRKQVAEIMMPAEIGPAMRFMVALVQAMVDEHRQRMLTGSPCPSASEATNPTSEL